MFPDKYDLGNGKYLELESSNYFAFPIFPGLTPSYSIFSYHKECIYTVVGYPDEFNKKIAEQHVLNFAYLTEFFHEHKDKRIIDILPKIEKLNMEDYKRRHGKL